MTFDAYTRALVCIRCGYNTAVNSFVGVIRSAAIYDEVLSPVTVSQHYSRFTDNPTASPTLNPSVSPSDHPSLSPTANPSVNPSASPTQNPSTTPSLIPTRQPSKSPSANPSVLPSAHPSLSPTNQPSSSPTNHPSLSPIAYTGPCMDIGGGNWTLVRHAYNQWHPATDNLEGTDEYGTYVNDPQSMSSWSIPFDQYLWPDGLTQLMFSDGDCSKWLIATHDTVMTLQPDPVPISVTILSSYTSATPYTAKWSNRQYDPITYDADPLISVGDHPTDLLYVEANSGGWPDQVVGAFFNVWIRILPRPVLFWDFESPAPGTTLIPDSITGNPNYAMRLYNGAQIIAEGLNCSGGFGRTVANIPSSVFGGDGAQPHSIEATFKLTTLSQDATSPIALDSATTPSGTYSPDEFDAIVFNEYNDKRFIAGSQGWQRTLTLTTATPETLVDEFIHFVITHDPVANIVTLYRNGPANPSVNPSASPTQNPSTTPSLIPTLQPSKSPSANPSVLPSAHPSLSPTNQPSSSPTNHPSLSPIAYTGPCMDIGGGNWTLVRHAYNQWHPATDNLEGTDEYGTYVNDPQSMSSWSIPFNQYLWPDGSTEFMFSNGDCSKWLITTHDQVMTLQPDPVPISVTILSSYTSDTPYTAKWSNRQYDPITYDEDPWISAGDHPTDLLYGEAANEHHLDQVLGAFLNVWIRIIPTRNPTSSPTFNPSVSPTVTKHWVQIATENAGAGPTAIWRHLAFDFYSQYPAESI
eukprot:919189_1